MGKINLGRVILGGIVAGIVSDVLDVLVDGIWLGPSWSGGMRQLGHSAFSSNQVIWFNLLGLAGGIATIGIYAAIRPRFGAGAKTAIYAGLAVWVLAVLMPNLGFMWFTGLFSHHLMEKTTFGGLIEVLAGALAGAALYKESAV
jgi:hypothetical protein